MTKTINGLTATSSAAAGDFLAIWRAANGDTRKITKANFIGATLTGGGTLATNGNTLNVPATGTVSLLNTEQTYTAKKTFNGGINLGNTDIVIYTEGTWTPSISGSGSDPTVTYNIQNGFYRRINNWVDFEFRILTINVSAPGTGDLRISLPFPATSGGGGVPCACTLRGVNLTPGVQVNFEPNGTNPWGRFVEVNDNAETTTVPVTAIGNSSDLIVKGGYRIS